MAQYNITAISARKNLTETNTAREQFANPDEPPSAPYIPFPSPAEFDTQELANAYAEKYANWLNLESTGGTSDWVGHANID
jgi:hypothetical protein